MPKMKTKSSAKKRFKVLGNGGVKRAHAFKRHILTKRTTKNSPQFRGTTRVCKSDMASSSKRLPDAEGVESMSRVKRGVTAKARHKKILALAKGYRGRRKNVYRVAKQAVMKAGQYAYRDRRQRKRVFRQLWIIRINAGARENGLSYSKFMNGLRRATI